MADVIRTLLALMILLRMQLDARARLATRTRLPIPQWSAQVTFNIHYFSAYNLKSFVNTSFQIVVRSTMVDVIDVLHALMIQKRMQWCAHARPVTQTRVLVQR